MSNKFLPKWDTIDSAQTAVSLHLLPPAILSISLTLFLFYTSHPFTLHLPQNKASHIVRKCDVKMRSRMWDFFSYSEDRALFYSKTLSWKNLFYNQKKLLKERENFHIWWGKNVKKILNNNKAKQRVEKRRELIVSAFFLWCWRVAFARILIKRTRSNERIRKNQNTLHIAALGASEICLYFFPSHFIFLF